MKKKTKLFAGLLTVLSAGTLMACTNTTTPAEAKAVAPTAHILRANSNTTEEADLKHTFTNVNMAQEIFKSKKTRKRTLLMEYPLTGKLYCAECGRPLIGDSGKNKKGYIYRYYTCIDKKKKRKCSLPSINKRVVEEDVTEIVRPLFNDAFIERIVDDALTNFSETHKAEEFANKLEAVLNEVKEQIKKYTDLLIQSRNIDIIMDKIDELKVKEKEVSDKYYEEKSKVVKVDRNAL